MMQAFPKAERQTIAVTYRCRSGHHDVRWWPKSSGIESEVICASCGWPAFIEESELQRHRHLRTQLESLLV